MKENCFYSNAAPNLLMQSYVFYFSIYLILFSYNIHSAILVTKKTDIILHKEN